MNIGEEIKRLRTSKKLTQHELAKRLQVTKSTISAYENGSRYPSYDVLIRIAKLFHVSTDNLLGYSHLYMIDVTGLTDKQRNTIQSIVSTYKTHNKLLAAANLPNRSYDDFIKLGYHEEEA